MPATWDRPSVSQGLLMDVQISFLSRGRGRTGLWCDWSNNKKNILVCFSFYSPLILSHMFYSCTTTKNSYLCLKGAVRKNISLHAHSNSKCFRTESLSSRLTLVTMLYGGRHRKCMISLHALIQANLGAQACRG